MIQQFHFWVYSQKNWEQGLKEIFETLFIGALFIITKHGSNSTIQLWVNRQTKYVLMEYYLVSSRKSFPTQWYSMEEPWGHKWNKPVTERQITIWPTYTRNLEESTKFIDSESRMVVARAWDEGESLFNGSRVSVLQDEKSPGDGRWWAHCEYS